MVLIRLAIDITYYNFAKSSKSAKMESIGDNLMSDRVDIFDTTLGMASSLPPSGISCTISFDAINGLLYLYPVR